MANYYSTVENKDNKFVGSVFVESTNQLVYQTDPLISQTDVLEAINSFIATNSPPEVSVPTTRRVPTRVITNSISAPTNVPLPVVKTRCCGR